MASEFDFANVRQLDSTAFTVDIMGVNASLL